MDQTQLRKREQQLAAELHYIRQLLKSGEGTGEPEATKQALRDGICVCCRGAMSPEETKQRGCHNACAQAIRREIKKGMYTDEDAVIHGKWAAPRITGRPTQVSTSKLSEIPGVHIASSDQLPESAPDDDGIDQPVGKPTKKRSARKSQSQAKSTPKRKSG